MAADFRYALRALLRAPGFFAIAVTTLCLGVAPNVFYPVLCDGGGLLRGIAARPGQAVQIESAFGVLAVGLYA